MKKIVLLIIVSAFLVVGAYAEIKPEGRAKLKAEKTEIDISLSLSEEDYYDSEEVDVEEDKYLPGDAYVHFGQIKMTIPAGNRSGWIELKRKVGASQDVVEGMILTDGYRFKQIRRLEMQGLKSQGLTDQSVMKALDDPNLGRDLLFKKSPYRCALTIATRCYLSGEIAKLEDSGSLIFPIDPSGARWNRTNYKKDGSQAIAENHVPAFDEFMALLGPYVPQNFECVRAE